MYTESTMPSGFFLKKKPPYTELVSARLLENRSRMGHPVGGSGCEEMCVLRLRLACGARQTLLSDDGLILALWLLGKNHAIDDEFLHAGRGIETEVAFAGLHRHVAEIGFFHVPFAPVHDTKPMRRTP